MYLKKMKHLEELWNVNMMINTKTNLLKVRKLLNHPYCFMAMQAYNNTNAIQQLKLCSLCYIEKRHSCTLTEKLNVINFFLQF